MNKLINVTITHASGDSAVAPVTEDGLARMCYAAANGEGTARTIRAMRIQSDLMGGKVAKFPRYTLQIVKS